MQYATAKLSSFRMSPRKVRLVCGLIRGMKVSKALAELEHRAKRAAPTVSKLVSSAVANAKALGMNVEALRIVEIRVDKGSVLKRSMPRAFGRAFPIHKHTSHIMIKLGEEVAAIKPASSKAVKTTTKVAKVEAPVKKTTTKKTK
jgi:large subunit ribosomal protein L22